MRLAWGISLILIIAAEMVGATVGLGYMVLRRSRRFAPSVSLPVSL
jgi:ABC-type nitrate/sulfonate/bicarbonate transport system permease component